MSKSKKKGFPNLLVWMASKRWGRALAKNVYTPVDKFLYRVSGGRFGLSPRRSVLYLTTTGRKSGRPRRVPILYLPKDGSYWVMASNYGQEKHPGWSSNLLANPEATVQMGKRVVNVRARLAGDDEKRELWPRLLELYPSWQQYTEWTDRNFRLFALEPTDGSVSS